MIVPRMDKESAAIAVIITQTYSSDTSRLSSRITTTTTTTTNNNINNTINTYNARSCRHNGNGNKSDEKEFIEMINLLHGWQIVHGRKHTFEIIEA